jgi:chromosome partitioning protein
VEAARELGHAVAEAQLGNRVAYPASMGEGRTALETAPSGIAAMEVEALAREILKHARKR